MNLTGWKLDSIVQMERFLLDQDQLERLDLSTLDINHEAANYILDGVVTANGNVLVKNEESEDYILNPLGSRGEWKGLNILVK